MNLPFITIIIPTHNEESNIGRCLGSIIKQDYPLDKIEVLIVDGRSTDNTKKIIFQYQSSYHFIQLLDNPGRIVPKGMNIAIKKAMGSIIVRVDGHTEIATDYLSKCVETIYRTNADNVGGCMNAYGNTYFGKVVAIATSTKFGIGNSIFHYSAIEEETDSVYMGAWKKTVFERLGLFDEELVRDQDDELNYRLRKLGGKIILNPSIKSSYITRSTPQSLWKQYFQYGYYKVRVLQKHPRQMSVRQFIPPLFVLSLLVSMTFGLVTHYSLILFSVILITYLIANLAASLLTAAKRGWKHFFALPMAFAVIHISYGAGFLAGLVKFWNRWRDKKGQVPNWQLE